MGYEVSYVLQVDDGIWYTNEVSKNDLNIEQC